MPWLSEGGGEAAMFRHYVEGVLQDKELAKCLGQCWLGLRMPLSAAKQEMRLKSDADGCAPCGRDGGMRSSL